MAKMDVPAILEKLAAIRERLPLPEHVRNRPKPVSDTRANMPPLSSDAMADFEQQALIDALESMADEVHAIVEEKRAQALEKALEIYYAAEELAKDPANAELIPQLEAMRKAYEKDFGKPIPPRPNK